MQVQPIGIDGTLAGTIEMYTWYGRFIKRGFVENFNRQTR